jgi:hypothetical protein
MSYWISHKVKQELLILMVNDKKNQDIKDLSNKEIELKNKCIKKKYTYNDENYLENIHEIYRDVEQIGYDRGKYDDEDDTFNCCICFGLT